MLFFSHRGEISTAANFVLGGVKLGCCCPSGLKGKVLLLCDVSHQEFVTQLPDCSGFEFRWMFCSSLALAHLSL